jgi:hypothetical protein
LLVAVISESSILLPDAIFDCGSNQCMGLAIRNLKLKD